MKNFIPLFLTAFLLTTTIVYHNTKEQDIVKAIKINNPNPSFTKDTNTVEDFDGAAITMFKATWCAYCKGAMQLLNENNIEFTAIDVDDYNISKAKLKEVGIEDFFVPQIFVDGVPIGGFSDLKKIFGSDMPVPKVS